MDQQEQERRFASVLAENRHRFGKIAHLYAGAAAEDLLQEIFLQVWRSMPTFSGNSQLSTWCYRVAINTALTWRRKQTRRRNEVASDHIDVNASPSSPSECETQTLLHRFLSTLSEIDQSVLLMHLFLLLIPLFSLIKDARHSYDKRSPFSAIRWGDHRPQVQVDGQWYELLKIDDVSAAEIIKFSRYRYLGLSRKRFEEDLVEVMTRMGHPPGTTSKLTVKQLPTGQAVVLENVEWTRENRSAIKRRNDNR